MAWDAIQWTNMFYTTATGMQSMYVNDILVIIWF